MTVVELVLLLAVAAGLGLVSQKITGVKAGGLIVSIILGFVGAYLGKEAAFHLRLPDVVHITVGPKSFPLIWAVLGAVVVTLFVGSLQGTGAKKKNPR